MIETVFSLLAMALVATGKMPLTDDSSDILKLLVSMEINLPMRSKSLPLHLEHVSQNLV